jgi:CDGSH-type Zn-finger protein
MLARLRCRVFGHNMKTQATFPARQGKPPVVMLLCRCGATANIPVVAKG